MGQILTFPASRASAPGRSEPVAGVLEARESFDFGDPGARARARPPLAEEMERFFEAEYVALRWKFGEIDRAEAERWCIELLGGQGPGDEPAT